MQHKSAGPYAPGSATKWTDQVIIKPTKSSFFLSLSPSLFLSTSLNLLGNLTMQLECAGPSAPGSATKLTDQVIIKPNISSFFLSLCPPLSLFLSQPPRRPHHAAQVGRALCPWVRNQVD